MSYVKTLLEEVLEDKMNEAVECSERLNMLTTEIMELNKMLAIAQLMADTDDFITPEDLF